MKEVLPDAGLLKPGEPALMMCLICQCRLVKKSWLTAKRAWAKHQRETGHTVGWDRAKTGDLNRFCPAAMKRASAD